MKKLLYLILSTMLFIYSGCSLNKMAMNAMADALSEGNGPAYTGENDPQFVGEALPFGLKTMEVILESTPEHTGLLTAAASGFVQYGHGFVLYPAADFEHSDYSRWLSEKKRAKQFFLRARDYGLRALVTNHFALDVHIEEDPGKAVMRFEKDDVPAIYWTGAAWASALSVDKSDMSLVADLPIIEALMSRALELDESWDSGAIHEFFIVYDAGRPENAGGGFASAEKHFKRAMELNGGSSISPLVSLSESVCIPQQDRKRFKELLNEVLKFNVDDYPNKRLANILLQQKAERLLNNIDLYFIE